MSAQPGERERLLSTLMDLLRIDSGTSDMDREVYVACYRLLEADAVNAQDAARYRWLRKNNLITSWEPWVDHNIQAEALAAPTLADEKGGGICPNCVSPWKCNGPHIGERPPSGY